MAASMKDEEEDEEDDEEKIVNVTSIFICYFIKYEFICIFRRKKQKMRKM